LHNMARARRLACIPRLCVPTTRLDLALNRAEVLRVVNTGSVDFATARMLLWAMDLTAAALPAEPTTRPRRARNPNVFYYVPIKPLFSRSCTENHSQVPENTRRRGKGGYHLTMPTPLALASAKSTRRPGCRTVSARNPISNSAGSPGTCSTTAPPLPARTRQEPPDIPRCDKAVARSALS